MIVFESLEWEELCVSSLHRCKLAVDLATVWASERNRHRGRRRSRAWLCCIGITGLLSIRRNECLYVGDAFPQKLFCRLKRSCWGLQERAQMAWERRQSRETRMKECNSIINILRKTAQRARGDGVEISRIWLSVLEIRRRSERRESR